MRFLNVLGTILLWCFPPYWVYAGLCFMFWPTRKKRLRRDIRWMLACIEQERQALADTATQLETAAGLTRKVLQDHPNLAGRVKSFLGDPEADAEIAKRLRRRVDELGRLITAFNQQHLPNLANGLDMVDEETFDADVQMAQVVLQGILLSLGPWSIPMRVMMAFGISRIGSYGVAWVLYALRCLLIRVKLGGLVRRADAMRDLVCS